MIFLRSGCSKNSLASRIGAVAIQLRDLESNSEEKAFISFPLQCCVTKAVGCCVASALPVPLTAVDSCMLRAVE